jgi:hypothetical protein
MTISKEEFDQRITAVVEMAKTLSNVPDAEGSIDRGVAISFYERLVEDLDARLEMLMDEEMRHSKDGGLG